MCFVYLPDKLSSVALCFFWRYSNKGTCKFPVELGWRVILSGDTQNQELLLWNREEKRKWNEALLLGWWVHVVSSKELLNWKVKFLQWLVWGGLGSNFPKKHHQEHTAMPVFVRSGVLFCTSCKMFPTDFGGDNYKLVLNSISRDIYMRTLLPGNTLKIAFLWLWSYKNWVPTLVYFIS